MAILNYTTKVAPHRTVAEIQQLLATKGAESVTVDYGAQGRVNAVLFRLTISGQRVQFRMPCNVDGVLKALQKERVSSGYQTKEHAESVAWRIVKTWVEAQLALVEANQAQLAEVFLPYAQDGNGRTAFQMFEQIAAKGLLTAGEPTKESR